MHHAALDGTGPHDRHLDDEVVVGAWLQPRQHRHLRPAFDLEHADRIGLAQHVVDGGIVRLHADGALLAVVLLDQVEALAQAGQHAEPQHVDLVDPERVEVVLVPFDDGAVFHGRVLDRHQLVEPARRSARSRRHAARDDAGSRTARPTVRAPASGAESVGSRPASRTWPLSTPPEPMPHTVSAMAPTVSGDRPSALPTSRMALRLL